MNIFGISTEKMQETSSIFTLQEIYQQPATWRKTCAQIAACKDELQAFLDKVVKADDFDIVLTGAGTSEFVGNSLFQALNEKYNLPIRYANFSFLCNTLKNLTKSPLKSFIISFCKQEIITYFFLFATVLLGPLHVLAFVLVFCPRTGRDFL